MKLLVSLLLPTLTAGLLRGSGQQQPEEPRRSLQLLTEVHSVNFCPLELNRCIASCREGTPEAIPYLDFEGCQLMLNICRRNPCGFDPTDPNALRDEMNRQESGRLNADPDRDGLSTGREEQLGTDPFNNDTDFDGVNDFDEVDFFETDPLDANADKDGDGLADNFEILVTTSDPNKFDTDGDGLNDGVDPDPNRGVDSDGDNLSDLDETTIFGTNPRNNDTDGDGVNDFDEGAHNTDALFFLFSLLTLCCSPLLLH